MIYNEWDLDIIVNWYEDVKGNRVKAGIDLSKTKKNNFEKE